MGGVGRYAARLFLSFSFPCSAGHERDWPPCKVVFFGLATNKLNVRNSNKQQGKEKNFRGHKLTQNKVQKNNDKIKNTQRKSQHLRQR